MQFNIQRRGLLPVGDHEQPSGPSTLYIDDHNMRHLVLTLWL